ncbi:hypothetical protein JQX13_14405 [Archangium violaceum]|nr:hypothetical protein JQX13_14405 [Archangium violaceum]
MRRSGLSTLVAVALGVFAGAAQAQSPCPSQSIHPEIYRWELDAQGKGVYLCRAKDGYGNFKHITVQVVDLAAGAKMRIMSEVAPGSPIGTSETLFVKRTAQEWYNWIKLGNATVPPIAQLFSVTSGSFTMPTAAATAHLSFAEKKWGIITTTGNDPVCYYMDDGSSAKRMFGLSDPRAAGQQFAAIRPFDVACQAGATPVNNAFSGYFDALVGFHPLYGDATRRTNRSFIGSKRKDGAWAEGKDQDVVYLLTSTTPTSPMPALTLNEAHKILANDFGAQWTVQLAGGGDAQYFHQGFEDPSPNKVPVPEVLVVYQAP